MTREGVAVRCLASIAIAAVAIACGDDNNAHTRTPADSGWDGGPVCGPCADAGKDARVGALGSRPAHTAPRPQPVFAVTRYTPSQGAIWAFG